MLTCQKGLFSLPADEHYLNCAYMSPLLKSAEEAGMKGLLKKRNPASFGADDFFIDVATVKSLFAQLINGEAERVALIPAASYGMGIITRNLKPGNRKKIVTVDAEFPSNVLSLQRMCNEHKLELDIVKPPKEGQDRGKRWNEKLLEAIDDNTALVNFSTVHWADGTMFNAEAIGKRAKEVGALYVLDGTQSLGASPFDVKASMADAVVCAGYKWLLGPYTTGFAWLGEYFDDGIPLEENWKNRESSSKFRALTDYPETYMPMAGRYNMGESSNFISLPMQIAALKQILEWKPSAIEAYCRSLTKPMIAQLKEKGYTIEDDEYRSAHIIGCRPSGNLHIEEVQKNLAEKKVTVSLRGNAIRISPHIYNDEVDVAQFCSVL